MTLEVNMRKIIIILGLTLVSLVSFGQAVSLDSLRSYTNTEIITNDTNAITGNDMNTILLNIIEWLDDSAQTQRILGRGLTLDGDTIDVLDGGIDSTIYWKLTGTDSLKYDLPTASVYYKLGTDGDFTIDSVGSSRLFIANSGKIGYYTKDPEGWNHFARAINIPYDDANDMITADETLSNYWNTFSVQGQDYTSDTTKLTVPDYTNNTGHLGIFKNYSWNNPVWFDGYDGADKIDSLTAGKVIPGYHSAITHNTGNGNIGTMLIEIPSNRKAREELSGNTTMKHFIFTYEYTTGAGNDTITLGSGDDFTDKEYYIVKVDAGAGALVTDGVNINGSGNKSLTAQWESILIYYNGNEWIIKAEN